MGLSPAVKLFMILTVPLTLGFKAVTGEPDSYESKAAISEFLSRHRFEIQEQTVAGIPTVVATSGACRMIVAEGSPNGWTRDMTWVPRTPSSSFFGEPFTRNNLRGGPLQIIGYPKTLAGWDLHDTPRPSSQCQPPSPATPSDYHGTSFHPQWRRAEWTHRRNR